MKRRENRENVEAHLGLFSSPLEPEMVRAEERALRRLRSKPVAPTKEFRAISHAIRRDRRWRFCFIGAAAVVVLVVAVLMRTGIDVRAVVEAAGGGLYRVSGGQALQAGEKIEANEAVRTTNGSGTVLRLADGSRVEMRSTSELSFERANDGIRINLIRGGVIVNAARQQAGRRLSVQTKHVTVSVVGTIFLVYAEERGSRVAVIEGEVRVQHGSTEERLRTGEQMTTNPEMDSTGAKEKISSSRNAETRMAMLQQTSVKPPEPRDAFEEASVRQARANPLSGGRGGPIVRACTELFLDLDRAGNAIWRVQLDPARFVVTRTNLYTIITWAYGKNCAATERGDLLSGGPGWIKTDEWDIEALIQDGTPGYTRREFVDGNAPILQKKLQNLLAERFKLQIRREVKDVPAYVLTLGKGPLKLTPTAGPVGLGALTGSTDDNGQQYQMLMAVPPSNFARMLMLATGRVVVDRTDITTAVTLDIEYAPFNGGAGSSRPSLFTALEEVGLKLEEAKVPMELLVIERVEKPSEN